jgi:hypothetical protein
MGTLVSVQIPATAPVNETGAEASSEADTGQREYTVSQARERDVARETREIDAPPDRTAR